MRCRQPLRTEVGLAVALSIFTLLLLLLSQHVSPPTFQSLEEPQAHPEALAWPAQPSRPLPTPCRANTSVAALPSFAEQPQQVRDFLLYKHCRDFPLLQDVPPSKCAPPVFLLLVIKSSPRNYERRELVRRTWGRERRVKGVQLRRLFLVGTAPDPLEARKVNRLLAMEARAHGDILQWDFYDSFFNLTLKQVGGQEGVPRSGPPILPAYSPSPPLTAPREPEVPTHPTPLPPLSRRRSQVFLRGGREKGQGGRA